MALYEVVGTDVRWGEFVLPNVLSRPKMPRGAKLRSVAVGGRAGEYALPGLPGPRRVTVEGGLLIAPGSVQTIEQAWRELCAGLPIGDARKLYVDHDQARFFWAQVETVDDSSSNDIDNMLYSVVFFVPDGLEYDNYNSLANLGNGVTNFAVGGTYPAEPKLIVTVSAAPDGGVVSFALSTGAVWNFSPDYATEYTFDFRLGTATRSVPSGVASSEILASSRPLYLPPGNLQITRSTPGGATVSAARIEWNNTFQ